jgi:glutamate-1-semialdehyde 2,1-aminomutase
MVPGAEMTRFTNSGTEANMYATRLARAFTRRDKVAKFEGGWHGGYDALQVAVKYPFDLPESAGLTAGATRDTIALPFNDLIGVEERLQKEPVASIVIEPVQGSGGGVPAEKEFLKGLRELCDKEGILLVFDEVITGFRLAPGGAQQYFGVKPDITVFGKILGGGFPVGAFSGRTEIMEHLNSLIHERPHYSFHGGTFAGNPITMTAGLATLRQLEDGRIINDLNKKGTRIRQELTSIFGKGRIDCQVVGASSIFNTHFTKKEVKNALDASKANRKMLLAYDLALIANGAFLLPAHNGVISSTHSNEDFEKLFEETQKFARQANSRQT